MSGDLKKLPPPPEKKSVAIMSISLQLCPSINCQKKSDYKQSFIASKLMKKSSNLF